MNEDVLIAISGIGLVLVFLLPFLAIPFILIKYYQKSRAKKAQARLESQAESTQKERLQPSSPQRARLALIGWTVVFLLWGVMFGFAFGVFSNLVYLVFIFPWVIGIINGKVFADFIQKAKIRNTSQLIFLSVLSVVTIYGMLHYMRFVGFQVLASIEISEGFSDALEDENLAIARAVVDYALQEETGHPGFVGYMIYKANEGVSIGRAFRSSRVNLGPVLTWFYWLMEFGIILGVTNQKVKQALAMPFCEECGNYYSGEKHLGGTVSANESMLMGLIEQKDFIGLGKLMDKNAELPSLEVYYQGCAVCGKSSSQLVVRRASQGYKGMLQFTDAFQTSLQPAESVMVFKQFSFSGD